MTSNVLRRIDEVVEGDRDFLERLRRVAALYGDNFGDFAEIDAFVRLVHKASGERVPDDFQALGAEAGGEAEDAEEVLDEEAEEDLVDADADTGDGRSGAPRRMATAGWYDPFDEG